MNAVAEMTKAAKPKKERKKRDRSAQNDKNPLAAAHRSALKEDQEMSEIKRLAFVGQNLSLFQVFLTKGYALKATEAAAELAGDRVVRKMSIDEPKRSADVFKGRIRRAKAKAMEEERTKGLQSPKNVPVRSKLDEQPPWLQPVCPSNNTVRLNNRLVSAAWSYVTTRSTV